MMQKNESQQQNKQQFCDKIQNSEQSIKDKLILIKKKIQKYHDEKQKRIKEIKSQKFRKYLKLDKKANQIINSEVKISQEIIQNGNFFTDSQKIQIISHKTDENRVLKPYFVKYYWKKVFLSSQYGKSLSKFDNKLLQAMSYISVQCYDEQKIQISMQFNQENTIIKTGKYIRILYRDQNQLPINFVGDHPNFKNILNRGLFYLLFTDTKNTQKLHFINQFFKLLGQEIVPYSLQYYLKKQTQEVESSEQNFDDVQNYLSDDENQS